MPGIADNALVKAAPLIEKLAAYRPEAVDRAGGRRLPRRRARRAAAGGRGAGPARRVDPLAVETIEPLLAFTLSPTMIEASERRNVIPGTSSCRRPAAAARPDARGRRPDRALDPRRRRPLRARDDRALRRHALAARDAALGGDLRLGRGDRAGCEVAPLCCAGFTDSHWLREAFGTVAYGFFPMRTMSAELAARLIHSADERTHVDDLGLGVDFLRASARSLA